MNVSVYKHGSVNIFTPPPPYNPLGSKVKYLNFAVTKAVVVIFFTEFLCASRGSIDIKHIRQDFTLKAWVQYPGGGLKGGA